MSGGMKQIYPDDEGLLIAALRSGDDKALKQLYRQHHPVIANLVVTNGGSLQEAKDVFQEALIIFYEKVQDDEFVLTCRIKTYLYSVARKIWLRQLERKNKFAEPLRETDDLIDADTGEGLQREEQFRAMHTALESMGEPCRSILKDFYLHNRSMEEITERFGYTNADNAKNQKYKCLKRLKKMFFSTVKDDTNHDDQPAGN